MKGALIVLGVVVLAALLIGGQLMGMRNSLVVEKNDIDGKFAEVDNAMKRRADLIPNLVETVKGFAKQEKGVYDDIAAARSRLLNAAARKTRLPLTTSSRGALGRLLVVVENYPATEIERELPPLAGRVVAHGKPHRDCAQGLQRRDHEVQHRHRPVPQEYCGVPVWLPPQRRLFQDHEEEKKVPQVKF